MATVLPYINISFILLSAISIAFGWYFIRRQKVDIHRRFMLLGSFLAAAFFISYVVKTIVVGDTSYGGPAKWKMPYQVFLQTHSILATVAGVLGLVTLYYAFKQKFSKHRRIGPWTAVIWFITAVSGLMVFLLLYVIFTPGPTTNMFRAWVGH